MGSKVPSKESILKEKEDHGIHFIDETLIKVGSEYIWLWITLELKNKEILALLLPKISKERNMFVAERFIDGLVKVYGRHPVSTDGERT